MSQLNPLKKTISEFYPVNGIGTVVTKKGNQDVFVYGYFTAWDKWSFIVHQDVEFPEFCTVSEASTGYQLIKECYYSVEDALYFSVPIIESKRYYFSTIIKDILVSTQQNLLQRNTTNLQTLAIDMLW